jgi:hypothetical protein
MGGLMAFKLVCDRRYVSNFDVNRECMKIIQGNACLTNSWLLGLIATPPWHILTNKNRQSTIGIGILSYKKIPKKNLYITVKVFSLI